MIVDPTSIRRIMVAPTGARRCKSDHPSLPMTVEETVADAIACRAAGATALHLHVRDPAGHHSLSPALYKEALAAVKNAMPDFPIQITTEAAGVFGVSEQLKSVEDVGPDAVSISVREMAREPELAKRMYAVCADRATAVQHIIYDASDWQQLCAWWDAGVVRPQQTDFIYVLGTYAPSRPAHPDDLKTLPFEPSALTQRWMVCAFGPFEQQVLCAAAALGADLRVGFENNIHAPNGSLAHSNAANVSSLRAALYPPEDLTT